MSDHSQHAISLDEEDLKPIVFKIRKTGLQCQGRYLQQEQGQKEVDDVCVCMQQEQDPILLSDIYFFCDLITDCTLTLINERHHFIHLHVRIYGTTTLGIWIVHHVLGIGMNLSRILVLSRLRCQ